MKKFATILLLGAVLLQSCGMSNLGKGSLIGSGAGAAIGAGVGYLISKDGKGAAIGAAIGTAVGGGTGAIIGNQMDKKAKELEALQDAQIETITDVNGLTAPSKEAKEELGQFAAGLSDLPDTDLTIIGHTDNVGTAEANQSVSEKRANAVAKFFTSKGINAKRLHAEGHSFNEPVASNDTAEGQAKNRRVEVYVTANEAMIEAAKAEAAKQGKE